MNALAKQSLPGVAMTGVRDGRAYYNEIEPAAAHVLRSLIADGLIAPGDVDDRSIKDVQPDDLAGYAQCHFFAGAGLWSVAARLAGWPDARPIWTGSCPCQPFSAAGRGLGTDDPRHLWPDFFRLIRACRPPVVMGEQVAGAPGYGWFDGVRADLAREDFASRVVDIPACAVDAPHIRQRLYWCAVADAGRGSDEPRLRSDEASSAARSAQGDARQWQRGWPDDRVSAGAVVHPAGLGWREGRPEPELRRRRPAAAIADAPGDVANADSAAFERGRRELLGSERQEAGRRGDGYRSDDAVSVANANGSRPAAIGRDAGEVGSLSASERRADDDAPLSGGSHGAADDGLAQSERRGCEGRHEERRWPGAAYASDRGHGRNGSAWSGADWIACHDGKARRTEPGLRLLVDGMAGRVPAWRLAGNSISPVLAAEVIGAYLDAERCAA